MAKNRFFKFGLVATIATAVCCFTPVLVWTLAAAGLSAWAAGLDWVLLPLLAASLTMLLTGIYRQHRKGTE